MNEQYENSLKYGLEALRLIEIGKKYFDKEFASREFWMHKNLVVSYFGLGQLDKFQKHKDILYKAYKKKKLPEGIDEYFNFSFFKWEDKNIWGYEWYPELGDPETKGSFTKIVVYVYSTNEDGSDNEQLFRFHVKKFHKFNAKSVSFDYLLEKQYDTEKENISGSYYNYTYNSKIDYIKLKSDILEILKNDIQPDSRRIIKYW